MHRSFINWLFLAATLIGFSLLALKVANYSLTLNEKKVAGGSATGNALEVVNSIAVPLPHAEPIQEEIVTLAKHEETPSIAHSIPLQTTTTIPLRAADIVGKRVLNKTCDPQTPQQPICDFVTQPSDSSSLYLTGGTFTWSEVDSLLGMGFDVHFLKHGFSGLRGPAKIQLLDSNNKNHADIALMQLYPNGCQIKYVIKNTYVDTNNYLESFHVEFDRKEFRINCL